MKALVLYSGGLDSTILLHLVRNKPNVSEVHALTIDYGQRNALELTCAQQAIMRGGWAPTSHTTIRIPPQLFGDDNPLTGIAPIEKYDRLEDMPAGLEQAYVPNRNLLFLTVAANVCHSRKLDTIYIGISKEGAANFPDCEPDFIRAAEKAINLSLDSRLSLHHPMTALSKPDNIRYAKSHLPGCWDALAYSYSCYSGSWPPCGHCHACLLRAKAFAEAGLDDPGVPLRK